MHIYTHRLQYPLQHKLQLTASIFANLTCTTKLWKLLSESFCNSPVQLFDFDVKILHSKDYKDWMHEKKTNSKLTSSLYILYVLDPWGRNPQPSELMLVESPNHLMSSRSRHAQHGQTGNDKYLFVCVRVYVYTVLLYVTVASRIDFNLGGFQIWLLLSTMSPKWQYRQPTTQRTFLPSDMRMLGCYM